MLHLKWSKYFFMLEIRVFYKKQACMAEKLRDVALSLF
jgi:hypothetical protein